LEKLIDNQARFGDVVHDLLDDLDMGEDRSSEADEEEGAEGEQDKRKDKSGEDGEGEQSEDAEARVDEAEISGEQMSDTTAESSEALSAEMSDDAEMGDWRRPPSRGDRADMVPAAAWPRVSPIHQQVRRDRGRGLSSRRARAAARLSDKRFRICRAWWRGLPTGCSGA
jgi:hypothetical protein